MYCNLNIYHVLCIVLVMYLAENCNTKRKEAQEEAKEETDFLTLVRKCD